MGWLWSTSLPASAPAQEKPSAQSLSEPTATPPNEYTSKPSPLRDDIAERELLSFLHDIEADTLPSISRYNRIPRQAPPAGSSSGSHEPISEQLLPTTMSCRDAFDAAFYCNSMGGQFNNLYRYGTVRACSENWNDFWFCMRTRTHGEKEKAEAIRSRYRDKERMKYGRGKSHDLESEDAGRSSEDIWKSRERMVEWGEAFNKSFPSFQGNDEEWNAKEKERRKAIVESQGSQ